MVSEHAFEDDGDDTAVVQQIPPMTTHYYKSGYPILSFMYGLYCDTGWSTEAFEKWKSTERETEEGEDKYEYEGYLDPYLNMPHGARQLITVEVPKLPEPPDGRRLPTVPLAKRMWPYLVTELTYERPQVYPGRTDPPLAPEFNTMRPVLSSLALVYLIAKKPPKEQVLEALRDPKYKGIDIHETANALEAIYVHRHELSTVKKFLKVIKPALVIEFTTPVTVW